MIFEEAVSLAREMLGVGYHVEALSCREDGRLGWWRIYFLGPPFSSGVNVVASREDWARFRQKAEGGGDDG